MKQHFREALSSREFFPNFRQSFPPFIIRRMYITLLSSLSVIMFYYKKLMHDPTFIIRDWFRVKAPCWSNLGQIIDFLLNIFVDQSQIDKKVPIKIALIWDIHLVLIGQTIQKQLIVQSDISRHKLVHQPALSLSSWTTIINPIVRQRHQRNGQGNTKPPLRKKSLRKRVRTICFCRTFQPKTLSPPPLPYFSFHPIRASPLFLRQNTSSPHWSHYPHPFPEFV